MTNRITAEPLGNTLGDSHSATTGGAVTKPGWRNTAVWWLLLWRRFKAQLGRARYWVVTTLTSLGWFCLVLSVAGLLTGLIFGLVEVLFIGVVALALLIMSSFFLIGKGNFHVSLDLKEQRVVAGMSVPATLTVKNALKRLSQPGRMDIPIGDGLIEIQLPFIAPQGSWKQDLEISTPHRGVIDVGPVKTIQGDPIGILQKEMTWDRVSKIYVHPVTTRVPSLSAGYVRDLEGSVTNSLVDSDIEFHALRDYRVGDSLRNIHWKSSAKVGHMMVRQYEETRRSRMLLAGSIRQDEYADAEEFELGLSAYASLATRGIRDGRELQAVIGGETLSPLVSAHRAIRNLDVRGTMILLDQIAAVNRVASTPRLEQLCELTPQQTRVSLAFLVCGSPVSYRRLRNAALRFSVDTAVIAVIADPEGHPFIHSYDNLTIIRIAVLEDLRQLLGRSAR